MKEGAKDIKGFFFFREKMIPSCHIMRKKKSKVTIFKKYVPTSWQNI
jgi:hypothetical protein